MPSASDGRSGRQPAAPTPAQGSRRRAGDGALTDSEYSVEVAAQVSEAMTQLGALLSDPGVAHTMQELEQVTNGFSATAEAMAQGLSGITEQLRAAGYAGPLSGHSSVVADRLVHASRELTRLAEAMSEAQRGGRSS